MDIADSIRRFRIEHDLTQVELGRITGVSGFAVSQWENGRAVPRMGAIQKMADHFGVPKSDIMGDRSLASAHGWSTAPLYGRIAAGEPLEMEVVDNRVDVPVAVLSRHPDGFCLKVEGESMNNVLPNGCYAYIAPCVDVEHDGKPYAVCVNGCDATIKRVRRLANGFELVPDSSDPTYKPRVYDMGNPADEKVTVIGEVVYHVMPYDWEY